MDVNSNDPLGCDAVEAVLDAFVQNNLSAEQRGRIDAHLGDCDECLDLLGQKIAQAIAFRKIPQAAKVRRELSLERWPSRQVMTWHRHRVPAPILQRLGYERALESVRLRRGVAMAGEDETVRIQVVNDSRAAVPGETIRAAVIELPNLTQKSEFRMSLWLDDTDAIRYRGYQAVCMLKLDNTWLAFDATVNGREIQFRADGLPALNQGDALSLNAQVFDYFLIPKPSIQSAL